MSGTFESLLTAIRPEAPSGSDLEYDPEFARMEKSAQGTPDQEFGSTHIEALPPDWETVRDAALNLLERTRDLRIGTYLTRAELIMRGLPGFRDGLQLLSRMADVFWDTVYPQLDPDDDNDPTIRINALLGLCEVGGLIRELRHTPILTSRAVGRFTLTDCAIARGELPVPAGMDEPPTQKKIDAAVQSCDKQELSALFQAVEQSSQYIAAIEMTFADRLGPANAPNLEAVAKELKSITKLQKPWLEQLAVPDAVASAEPTKRGLISVEGGGVSAELQAEQASAASAFGIGSREDAIEGLDKIIRWFERFEPSSPLPMLLKRAKRLSTMSFMEILRDISPDGIEQATVVGGRHADEPQAVSAPSKPAQSAPAAVSRPIPADDEY